MLRSPAAALLRRLAPPLPLTGASPVPSPSSSPASCLRRPPPPRRHRPPPPPAMTGQRMTGSGEHQAIPAPGSASPSTAPASTIPQSTHTRRRRNPSSSSTSRAS